MPFELSSETRALLALHLVPGLGPRLTSALMRRFHSPAAILRASPSELEQVPYLGASLAQRIARALEEVDTDAELERIEKHGVRLIGSKDVEFPGSLVEIPDAPHLLYLRGEARPADARAIAIVGSRHCTGYGRRVTEKLAKELVRAGFTVVSGLARGIDGVAHQAALDGGGRTLAVLAGGLSRIYPPEHTELAGKIEASGALLTEAPMEMEPMAAMFPARNRLISGLSRGVVIVEAAARSGALITASHAAEQGRPVFAVPGALDSPASAGTHALLRQGAILIRGTEDILEELDGIRAAASPTPVEKPADLDDIQARLWERLDDGSCHVDELVQVLGLSVAQVTGSLLHMEMRKLVRRLPGNQYERV